MNPLFNVSNFQRISAGQAQCVRMIDSLTAGQEIQIDFRDYTIDGDTFSPQGVIIDASQADGDCAVEIVETKFRIVCPKGAMVQMPYPAVAMQTALVNGDGNTKVFFTNYPIFPFNSAASSGGGMPSEYIESIVAGDNITIDATDPKNPVISASGGGGGGGSLGFAAVLLGGAGGAAGTLPAPAIMIQMQDGPAWSVADGKIVPPPGNYAVKITANVRGENAGGTLPALTYTTDDNPLARKAYPANPNKNVAIPFVYLTATTGAPIGVNLAFEEATTFVGGDILFEILKPM